MPLIVQKFGGTSVANIEKIRSVALRIAKKKQQGDRMIIVLSAMANDTNRLINMASEISKDADPKHVDLLISTGEQVSISLMAMAIKELGLETEPLLAYQIPIITDNNHTKARIKKIDTARINKALDKGKIVIIAGFQGYTEEGNITTIGRGGSDTTAVAIACAIKADYCEIFTDVDGVYTVDPRICNNAKKIPKISYEEMLELADSGAKVLQTRSVEIATKYRVPIHVRSSFKEDIGTWVVPEENIMEDTIVSGVTCNINEAKIAIRKVPDKIGITAKIFEPIAKAGINVDMIIQNVSADGFTDLTFTVPKEDLKKAIALTETVAKRVEAGKVEAAADIAKISIIGVGMRTHAGIAHKMFEALSKEGIGIQMIGTSEIKVSIVIDLKYAELATRILHEVFCLT